MIMYINLLTVGTIESDGEEFRIHVDLAKSRYAALKLEMCANTLQDAHVGKANFLAHHVSRGTDTL